VTRIKWKFISVPLEIMLILTQDRGMVYAECAIGFQIILSAPMGLVGDVGQVEACSVCLEIELISTQDRCMVCTECAIGSEIVFGASKGTPR
jgi:hypothetical protein